MSSANFRKGDSVLGYHGPLLYTAEVMETALKTAPDGSKIRLYLLTYLGWDSQWNEWVPESRVLRNNEGNKKLQKERVKEFQRAHRKRQRQLDMAAAAEAGGKAKAAKKSSDTVLDEIRENLRLPQSIKLKLIEDWERITREKKLVPLPAKTTVASLLDDYFQAKSKRNSHERLYGEVCDGIRTYFNQALPAILLYKFERRQLKDLKAKEELKDKPLVEMYGAEHLLRLFVKLPELLAHSKMQREHLTVLVAKLTELLKFVQTNKSKYFADEYQPADAEYLRWFAGDGDSQEAA